MLRKNLVCSAVLVGFSQLAQAQSEPVDLGEIDIINSAVSKKKQATKAVYESYDPVDSGVSVISQQAVENSKGGGIDTTELLQVLPYLQMDVNKDKVTQEDIQSIRPSDFSISGGNYYDNNIMIDGVSANSVHDVTSKSDIDMHNVAGQTAQTFYVDPALIGSVEVHDSNVSAEFGDFTGGVVNYKIRQPKKKFGVELSAGYQSDSMVKYLIDNSMLSEGENRNPPPDFKK